MIKKLKNFLFEQEETSNSRNPRRDKKGHQRQIGNEAEDNNQLGYAMAAVLILIVLFIVWPPPPRVIIDPETLCPAEEQHISGKTYILMDFSEPLSKGQQNELKGLIKVASENLKKRERLTISHMEPDPNNPSSSLPNLCNPVDPNYIEDAVGRGVDEGKDCPAIIAGEFTFHRRVGEETRQNLRDFCKKRSELGKKIENAGEFIPRGNPEQSRSYIVGSIEDIMINANGEPSSVPTRLVVFSDMVQNARWFSQYRDEDWTIERLRQERQKAANMGMPPEHVFSEVLLCYQSSRYIGNGARRKGKHKKMWEDYFEEAHIFKPIESGGCTGVLKYLMDTK